VRKGEKRRENLGLSPHTRRTIYSLLVE